MHGSLKISSLYPRTPKYSYLVNRSKPEYFGRRDDYLSYLSSDPVAPSTAAAAAASAAGSRPIPTSGSVLGSSAYQNLLPPSESNEAGDRQDPHLSANSLGVLDSPNQQCSLINKLPTEL